MRNVVAPITYIEYITVTSVIIPFWNVVGSHAHVRTGEIVVVNGSIRYTRLIKLYCKQIPCRGGQAVTRYNVPYILRFDLAAQKCFKSLVYLFGAGVESRMSAVAIQHGIVAEIEIRFSPIVIVCWIEKVTTTSNCNQH